MHQKSKWLNFYFTPVFIDRNISYLQLSDFEHAWTQVYLIVPDQLFQLKWKNSNGDFWWVLWWKNARQFCSALFFYQSSQQYLITLKMKISCMALPSISATQNFFDGKRFTPDTIIGLSRLMNSSHGIHWDEHVAERPNLQFWMGFSRVMSFFGQSTSKYQGCSLNISLLQSVKDYSWFNHHDASLQYVSQNTSYSIT